MQFLVIHAADIQTDKQMGKLYISGELNVIRVIHKLTRPVYIVLRKYTNIKQ